MSMLVRSLLRDPRAAKPVQRALRKFEDDFWLDDPWPLRRSRYAPVRHSPYSMIEQMDRQMSAAMNQMQELAQDLTNMDSLISRFDNDNWYRESRAQVEDCVVKRTESGGLQLSLDVGDFKPQDLKIQLVDDNHLVVEAVSESSGKDSYQKSHFKRWFKLPEDCKLDEIKSQLTDDNRLVIELPTNKPIEQQKARTIPIEMSKNAKKQVEGPDQEQLGKQKEASSN